MSPSKLASGKGSALGLGLDEAHALGQAQVVETRGGRGQHRWALVDAGHPAPVLQHQLGRDGARAGGDVQHVVVGPHRQATGEDPVPAGLLPEAEQGRAARVGGTGEAREEVQRLRRPRRPAALGRQ